MCSFEGNLTLNTSAKHPFGRCFPGVSFGGVPVIRFSMLGDVADLLQLQTDGKKDEGPIGITIGWSWDGCGERMAES